MPEDLKPPVTVKQLKWEECGTYSFTAWTEFGNYNIDRDGDGWWCFMHECHGDAFEESLADSFMDDESIVDQLKSEAQADFIRRCLSQITTQPVDVTEAAKVLLSDDIALSRMARAIHDGPLLADEYEYRADTKAGGWCLDCVRVGLRALTQQTIGEVK